MADEAKTEATGATADGNTVSEELEILGELPLMVDDPLLAEFYAFTYEEAVLVGGNSSPRAASPSKWTKSKLSPSKSSPTKQQEVAAGPSSAALSASIAPPVSREIMNALLPPKVWREGHAKWQRMVCLTPSSRTEVQRLETVFAQLLETHQARASAICPVREKFFLQTFEELIREVTCECPERGLLLLRVRDELRMSIEAYQTLYHNSIAYGRQKAVQAEAGSSELEERILRLELEKAELHKQKHALTHQLLLTEAELAEEKRKRKRRHAQELRFLREQHTQLETFYQELTVDTTWK
ncbi:hypothetical protein Poli38472_009398 [Pythium oligandrum]|uniref:Uncharacterized protein n=1 Tax=Pythium oligandrum TaxID=41045 RepID=A0A8K1CM70_PYTOL|nr:hypothetical protein Poli38472_009398 [Pythium oligandrum]|eukprot:TMW65231.1 hypothetical protein Poli38472_009398 [Pythium oligandrum]